MLPGDVGDFDSPYRGRLAPETDWRRRRDLREAEAAASIQRVARGRATRKMYRRRIDSRLEIRRGLEARKAVEREAWEREERLAQANE